MRRGVLYILLSVAVSLQFIAPLAYAAMPDKKPQLVIPDSLRATYKYTDALKALTIHDDTTTGLPLLQEALEIDSTYAPAHYELASFYVQKDMPRAIHHARKAYEQDTTSRWYMGLYGRTLAIAGEIQTALPIYRKLTDIDKNNPDNYRILALLYHQNQQPYSALATLDSAEVRFGKMVQLSDLKRMLLIRTNQTDRAIEEAQQAVEEAPYEVDNVISLGHLYASTGRDSLARVTLQSAIRMDSTNINALTTYADFCSHQDDVKGYLSTIKLLVAQPAYPVDQKYLICQKLVSDRNFYGSNYMAVGRVLNSFLIHHPDDKRAIDLYGDHLLAGGELQAALDFFKLHLDKEPPQMDYYMAVIDLEAYLEHPDSVDRYVAKAMTIFPDNPTLYIRKANRLYLKGNLQGAVDNFKSSLQIAQNDTLRGELWGYIGDTYHAMAERRSMLAKAGIKRDTSAYPVKISYKKAMQLCFESYDKALELYVDNAMTLNNYAYFLSEENQQLERALTMSSRAIILSENNATYLDTHAWVLYKLGRYDEARNVMRKALMLDSSSSSALLMHYGDILYALKEYFMAETYWQKALDKGADKEEVEQRMTMLKSNSDK